MAFASALLNYKRRIDAILQRLLPTPGGPAAAVAEAMRYAALGEGKRLRPTLLLATSEACGSAGESCLPAAAAIEMIHAYSLIHDDLPMMDDDDLRRGRATVHRAFDEATALLAGDALQALAFEILAGSPTDPIAPQRRLEAVRVVAAATGIDGMVGGQAADLAAQGQPVQRDPLRWIHERKTGALFAASAEVGAILGGADEATRSALGRYGAALGLAFQITDDVLDCTGTSEQLGKTAGKDERAGKSTYPALLGLEGSRRAARDAVLASRDRLPPRMRDHVVLAGLADHVLARTR